MSEIKKFAPPPKPAGKEISEKNAMLAAVLALFVGFYGVHNFYLGYKSRAIFQLILTLTVFGAFISGIWAIVESIMLFTGYIKEDGKGRVLKRG